MDEDQHRGRAGPGFRRPVDIHRLQGAIAIGDIEFRRQAGRGGGPGHVPALDHGGVIRHGRSCVILGIQRGLVIPEEHTHPHLLDCPIPIRHPALRRITTNSRMDAQDPYRNPILPQVRHAAS